LNIIHDFSNQFVLNDVSVVTWDHFRLEVSTKVSVYSSSDLSNDFFYVSWDSYFCLKVRSALCFM